MSADLSPLCAEFEVKAQDQYGSGGYEVLQHFGIDGDDSTPSEVWDMACAFAKALRTLRAMRETMVELRTVPPQSLRAALAEGHVCPECDEESCVCWAYDDSLPAPVDVHPANRAREASYIMAAKRRQAVADVEDAA